MIAYNKTIIVSILLLFSLHQNISAQTVAAAAKTTKGWGYIKLDQTWIIEPYYDRFCRMENVIAEDKGESVLCEYHEGLASFRRG
ncbi:MAG: hypothetical protein IPP71_18170 [Bacteroidetes bacterium]|nr:hypothetical protein [Bacteroidota bacterium]